MASNDPPQRKRSEKIIFWTTSAAKKSIAELAARSNLDIGQFMHVAVMHLASRLGRGDVFSELDMTLDDARWEEIEKSAHLRVEHEKHNRRRLSEGKAPQANFATLGDWTEDDDRIVEDAIRTHKEGQKKERPDKE